MSTKAPVSKSFDLEAVYDKDIAPLMAKVIDICKANKLPMLATFFYKSDGNDVDDFCTTNLYFKERPDFEALAKLAPIIQGYRGPAMRMRVTKGDGSIEETVILP